MSTATVVPLSEYLNTSYRPDCEYLDGELLERNSYRHALINPRTRRALVYTPEGVQEVKDGILCTKNPEIRVPLSELD